MSLFEQVIKKAQTSGIKVEFLQEYHYVIEKMKIKEFLTLLFNEFTRNKYSFSIFQNEYEMIKIYLFEKNFIKPISYHIFTTNPKKIQEKDIIKFNKSIKNLKQQRIIPIIGPDGVGKTTLLSAIIDNIDEKVFVSRFKKIVRRSIIYNIFYPINRYFLKKKLGHKPEKDQHDDVHYFLSLVAGILYYPYLVYKTLVEKKIVFKDRFFNDYLLENISFIEKKTKVRKNWKILMKLIPKVNWMLHLDASPEIILNRKNELTKEDIIIYKEFNFKSYLEQPSLVYTYVNTEADLEHCQSVVLYSGKSANILQNGDKSE